MLRIIEVDFLVIDPVSIDEYNTIDEIGNSKVVRVNIST